MGHLQVRVQLLLELLQLLLHVVLGRRRAARIRGRPAAHAGAGGLLGPRARLDSCRKGRDNQTLSSRGKRGHAASTAPSGGKEEEEERPPHTKVLEGGIMSRNQGGGSHYNPHCSLKEAREGDALSPCGTLREVVPCPSVRPCRQEEGFPAALSRGRGEG